MLEKSDIKALCTFLKPFVSAVQRKKTHWCVFSQKSGCGGRSWVYSTSTWITLSMKCKTHAHLRGFVFQDCHRHCHLWFSLGEQRSSCSRTQMFPCQANLIISTAILKFGATIFAFMTFTPYPVFSTWASGYSGFCLKFSKFVWNSIYPRHCVTGQSKDNIFPRIAFANSWTLFGKLSSPIWTNNLKLACCTTP